MPRQIIDTESSRPQYVRRLAIRWAIVVFVILIVAFVLLELVRAHHAAAAAAAALVPGNWLLQRNLAPIPHDRRGHAA